MAVPVFPVYCSTPPSKEIVPADPIAEGPPMASAPASSDVPPE